MFILITFSSRKFLDHLETSQIIIFEPVLEKTNNKGFRPGPTQTGRASDSMMAPT